MINPSAQELLHFFKYTMKLQGLSVVDTAALMGIEPQALCRLLSDTSLIFQQAVCIASALNCQIQVEDKREGGEKEFTCKSYSPFSK